MATFDELETISREVFDGPVPEGTVWIRWDFTTGERHTVIPVNMFLAFIREAIIQGIEIKSTFKVKLKGWEGSREQPPNLVIEGPTCGKIKIDPKQKINGIIVEKIY